MMRGGVELSRTNSLLIGKQMKIECDRCGLQCLSAHAFEKALERGKTPLCADCQQLEKPLYRVQGVDDYCVPHQGIFSPDDYPLDRSGRRLFDSDALCGKRDCIKESHYATPKLVKFSQPRHTPRVKRNAVRKAHTPVQDTLSIFDVIALVEPLAEASVVASRINASKKAGRISRGQAA
jgi:hypothetical protein